MLSYWCGWWHVIVTGLYHSGRPFLWPFQLTPIKEVYCNLETMSGMIDGRLVWIDTQWGHTAVWLTDLVWTVSDIEPFSGVVFIWMSTIEVGSRHDNDVDVDDMHSSGVFPLYDEALCRMRQYLGCQGVDRQPATPDIINCFVIRRCNFTEGRVCIL
jgi:hypothetical protein